VDLDSLYLECVAKYAQRPLLPLTVADIGTEESSIQAKLEKWFDLGEKWGAILLIDEADVFLESRTTASLQRNSLVSGIFISISPSTDSSDKCSILTDDGILYWNAFPGMMF